MELRKLSVQSRGETGSRATRRLREQGMIPAVLYAGGREAHHLAMDSHAYFVATKGAGQTQLYELDSEESDLNGVMALVKDVQVDPLADKTVHVDLLELKRGQRVTVTVSVKVIGECAAVKQGLAMLNQSVYELEVESLPRAIPEQLELDISGLNEGEGLHARDIELPEGVVLKSDPSLSVVSAVSQKAEEEEAPAEEGAEEAAPAAEEAADGEPEKAEKSE